MPWRRGCAVTRTIMPERDEAAWRYLRHWVRPALIEGSGYAPPPAGYRIKLDAMENPYPTDWGALAECRPLLNRYPDAGAGALRDVLRQIWSVPDALAIVPGNGSDELILYLCLLMAGDNRCVLSPEPSFVMYRHLSALTGFRYVGVPLSRNWQLDMPAMLRAIESDKPAIIWLAWPNNPTGTLYAREDILTLARATSGLLVVDEAYQPYSQLSLLDQTPLPDNVIVLRTLSKLGLAGLRLGAAVGHPPWMQQLEKIRLPYNIGSLPQAIAATLPACYGDLLTQVNQIRVQRQHVRRQLEELPGLVVWPSAANFLLLTLTEKNADTIYQQLLNEGILIKNLHGTHPSLAQCLRLTIGLPDENDEVRQTLQTLLAAR